MDYFEEVYIGSSISDSFEILSKSNNTTGCLILFLYTLIGWYDNNNDFKAIKMVFICSTHRDIWYHVVLICVIPHKLTH